jgi:4-alpha-glucanotransferase
LANRFQLVLLIHAHQPVGNFENVMESAYAKSYLPFIEVLARHPAIRAGLHYSGPLLEWIERAHPEYFERLRDLVRRGQVEMVGGGFYEPILIAIPPEDQQEQIKLLADYLEKHFGKRPVGAWLAERVWEPQLPSTLSLAGVGYTLVDDNHFLGAGFELGQLFGYYVAENQGRKVNVMPGLKTLRYLIPFRGIDETMQFLRKTATEHPGGFAAMGDDLEKFGIWPGTHEHCYQNGWIENFFTALENSSDWLEVTAPGDAIATRPPLGRADLPTASYTEMMEWALPTPARIRYHALTQEFSSRPDELPFVRGGIWRNFFSKYSESNLLQKKMLHVSRKLRTLEGRKQREGASAEELSRAKALLLRSQCNDPYWHGIFGGLYAPHLRTAPWRSLVEAEAILDRVSHRKPEYAAVETFDFDADGREEIYLTSDRYAALLQPDDGGTICVLDCRPSCDRHVPRARGKHAGGTAAQGARRSSVALINSLRRRPESYHERIRHGVGRNAAGVHSIHDQVRVKEPGLDRLLNYDRWPQHSFRFLLFSREKSQQDCAAIRLEEDANLAAGPYVASEVSANRVSLASGGGEWVVQKVLEFIATPEGFDIVCDAKLKRSGPGSAEFQAGLEVVVNFLAPTAADRYCESGGKRHPLNWSGAAPASELRVVDEWQKVGVTLTAKDAREFWICPIETVSESEEGFERIYQGSKIVAVWPVKLSSGREWQGRLTFKVAHLA